MFKTVACHPSYWSMCLRLSALFYANLIWCEHYLISLKWHIFAWWNASIRFKYMHKFRYFLWTWKRYNFAYIDRWDKKKSLFYTFNIRSVCFFSFEIIYNDCGMCAKWSILFEGEQKKLRIRFSDLGKRCICLMIFAGNCRTRSYFSRERRKKNAKHDKTLCCFSSVAPPLNRSAIDYFVYSSRASHWQLFPFYVLYH